MFANPNRIEPLALLVSRILNEDYEKVKEEIVLLPDKLPKKHLGRKKNERDIIVKVIPSFNNKKDGKK